MFHFADPHLGRKLILGSLAATLFICLSASGVVAYALRCNALDYLDRVSLNPLNVQDRYLFACGYVWHSLNSGQRWDRIDQQGLPLGVRDGYIAVDRQRGRLYLGILVNARNSLQCFDCAWKSQHPSIYISNDGGNTWAFSYKFKRGPSATSGFVGVYADPLKNNYVYTIIKNVDEITFYASGTNGLFGKATCHEYYDIGRLCHLPDSVMQFHSQLTNPNAK